MVEEILTKLAEFQYPGIFLISLISNSIPFVGLPYLNFLFALSPFFSFEDLVVVSILSALGASIGKIFVYTIGAGMRLTLSEKTKENLMFFEKIFKKWGFFAIFLFAASPLPDDVLYIPLGIAKYRISYYFLAVFLGKLVITSYVLVFGRITSGVIKEIVGSNFLGLLLFFSLTLLISVLVIKIDWKKLFEKYYRP
ncbi:MAG: VTT domain-containing protein [Archaeoglobaceae archaeon]|uniref:VTT domain-containing protein n=1 Tax=Archaeoglobus fulgidus TaxID=2234 RepID=A0A7J3M3S9_ARCFL